VAVPVGAARREPVGWRAAAPGSANPPPAGTKEPGVATAVAVEGEVAAAVAVGGEVGVEVAVKREGAVGVEVEGALEVVAKSRSQPDRGRVHSARPEVSAPLALSLSKGERSLER
jgi:hypothetical protein